MQHKKSFSQLGKTQKSAKTAELHKFLEKLSGGEVSEMLSFYLASTKGKPLRVKLSLNDQKFSKVIENIRGQHQHATPNNKRVWLSLVAKDLTGFFFFSSFFATFIQLNKKTKTKTITIFDRGRN